MTIMTFRIVLLKTYIFYISVEVVEGPELKLDRLTRADMGAYLCIAKNGIPSPVSKRIMIHVHCKFKTAIHMIFANVLTNYPPALPNKSLLLFNTGHVCKIINCFVSVPPLVKVHNEIVSAALGSTIKLTCSIEASPRSVNYWVMSRGPREPGSIHDELPMSG